MPSKERGGVSQRGVYGDGNNTARDIVARRTGGIDWIDELNKENVKIFGPAATNSSMPFATRGIHGLNGDIGTQRTESPYPVGGIEVVKQEAPLKSVSRVSERPLSARELKVLRLAGKGLSDKQIAAKLEISEKTVNVHIRSILEKLGVDSRFSVVVVALNKGWIKLEELRDGKTGLDLVPSATIPPAQNKPALGIDGALAEAYNPSPKALFDAGGR
jgi:DNA-binding CsgD family transcriptional regulator